MKYTEKVMEHFLNPQNARSMDDFDGKGYYGSVECGDYIEVFIKVNDNVLTDVSYMVYGCTASVATSSMMSILAKGKTIEQALEITEDDVEKSLDGLPEEKRHCSNLGVGALKNAIKNYKGIEVSYEESIF
ncbi:MAG: iron-sulfur cluster assembly scaffold protein [Clostridia bacterium]|nr:iron-sulfur cluster assembly scaffold protein [Clostridia bacterium]